MGPSGVGKSVTLKEQFKKDILSQKIENDKDIKTQKNKLEVRIKKLQGEIEHTIENISDEIDESLFYSFIDTIDKYNKFLILTSNKSLNDFNFKLEDLKSRLKNCLFAEIQKPDDILIQALITKNLADYQITIDSKLIDFISKRITRFFKSKFGCQAFSYANKQFLVR